MPDTAANLIYDEELDTSPEVLSLLMRRRSTSAALAAAAGCWRETSDDVRHPRPATRAHALTA